MVPAGQVVRCVCVCVCVLGIDEHGNSIAIYLDRMGEYGVYPRTLRELCRFEKKVRRTAAALCVYHD